MIFISFLLLIIAAKVSSAHEHKKKHQRMGSHGMVLFTDGTNLYANHLPLYRSPHDYQLIYQVNTNKNQSIIDYLQGHAPKSSDHYLTHMVTILPEPFDLNRLVNQQLLDIAATVFKGHFERGGQSWLHDVQFEFEKMLVNKQITVAENSDKPKKQQWLVRDLALKTDKLFIHVINEKPSFDAIVLGENCAKTMSTNTILVEQGLDKKSPLLLKTSCEQQSTLYYETQDFAE